MSWTKLPFRARNTEEFSRGLTDWLGTIFYETLPAAGYEVREEQIYTTFRMARAFTEGHTLFAEAGPGTGKTFAYLLPAICYARFTGSPVVVASATPVLQAQLSGPEGDIRTLSRLLQLDVDVRVAADPGEYLCEMKGRRPIPDRPHKGWRDLKGWAEQTGTGLRSEVPDVPDELWEQVAWDPGLPCDTCTKRGHCHVMAARREYRAAADLVVCDHRLFSVDLLTRSERHESGQLPLLPAYSAVVFDEGHHLPETWQRSQGFMLDRSRLERTLSYLGDFLDRPGPARAVKAARVAGAAFFRAVDAATEAGEVKRHVERTGPVTAAAGALDGALEALQDHLVTEEAMNEGLELEVELRAYQTRMDEVREALRLFRSDQSVPWAEGGDLWVVPRRPASLFGRSRLARKLPVIFSSATLEPAYQARVLHLEEHEASRVGVPFDLSEQALVYEPGDETDLVAQALAVMRATEGRALILLRSMAEVRQWRKALAAQELPWTLLVEGEGDRGTQLERFRHDVHSVLIGATFWEGVDVPGEALSCVIIPYLPFPAHDPLIRERREQAAGRGEDPDLAVDLPEMLIKLKQGAGRLIRSAHDRGVLALLAQEWRDAAWADKVAAVLPEDSERTADLERVRKFLTAVAPT